MNKKAKEMKISDARRKEHLEGELITKCCEMVDSGIRVASHILDIAHLEFEALMTVMILVTANFLAGAVKVCRSDTNLIDLFLDEVREKTHEFIREDSKDRNAN